MSRRGTQFDREKMAEQVARFTHFYHDDGVPRAWFIEAMRRRGMQKIYGDTPRRAFDSMAAGRDDGARGRCRDCDHGGGGAIVNVAQAERSRRRNAELQAAHDARVGRTSSSRSEPFKSATPINWGVRPWDVRDVGFQPGGRATDAGPLSELEAAEQAASGLFGFWIGR